MPATRALPSRSWADRHVAVAAERSHTAAGNQLACESTQENRSFIPLRISDGHNVVMQLKLPLEASHGSRLTPPGLTVPIPIRRLSVWVAVLAWFETRPLLGAQSGWVLRLVWMSLI